MPRCTQDCSRHEDDVADKDACVADDSVLLMMLIWIPLIMMLMVTMMLVPLMMIMMMMTNASLIWGLLSTHEEHTLTRPN